ncbi:inositol 1,4,5-trisphosphate receptor type 2-like, partial [Sinocyclocheilus grahami]|uniref:inositol 1,4,5-trisphosphate receptor type 2-like n=1 Tax=Sinocyclocheilus grahami TaxID=75366 RepID=UPI0007ACB91A
MEQIVFPVPNICEYLTEESKVRVFTTTERDDQGSKVNDFFQQFDDLYNEMRWQKKIRNNTPLFWVSKHISLWESISFNMAVLINLAVALFYPFGDDGDEGVLPPFLSILLWVAVVVSTFTLFVLPQRGGILAFLVTIIFRSIYTLGLGPTLLLLGAANIKNESDFMPLSQPTGASAIKLLTLPSVVSVCLRLLKLASPQPLWHHMKNQQRHVLKQILGVWDLLYYTPLATSSSGHHKRCLFSLQVNS